MDEFYVDAAAEGGGSGSIDNPFNSFGQWSAQDVGSTLVFRGSTDPAKPRDYGGGAIYSPKNYVIRAYPGEFVRFTDPGADASLLTFEAWTGGGIDASEGGITFGPGAPNYPEDGTYWLGTLQLTGCSGMYLVGGPDRLLRFAGASDIGLYLVDYPGGGHGAARGCRDITLQGFETTELATGVLVRSGGSPDAPALGGQGVVIQDGTSHHHNLLLDNRGQGSDSGAVGITLYACSGVRVRRFDAHDNHAPSKDYGTDGGAFEAYGARDYVLEDFRFWNNEGGIETGRGGNVSIGAGGIIRHGIIMGSSNMGGHVPPRIARGAAARLRGWTPGGRHVPGHRRERDRAALQRPRAVRRIDRPRGHHRKHVRAAAGLRSRDRARGGGQCGTAQWCRCPHDRR